MTVLLELPEGWHERPDSGGPREFWASSDGATGILQLSTLPSDQAEFVCSSERLDELAMEIGKRLGWPNLCAGSAGTCAMGRFGFAVFRGGAFQAMFLWLTASDDGAFLWTWLGPDPVSATVREAVSLVLKAKV
jgi:hypothetical protein